MPTATVTRSTRPAKRGDPLRAEARERGLPWARVLAVYEQVKEEERAKRQRPDEIRRVAWTCFTAHSPGCWPFWYHGFRKRYEHRLARGADHTCIPGYDVLAQQIAAEYPEYRTEDGTERLWDFLLSPRDRMPTRLEMIRRAMHRLERLGDRALPAEASKPWEDF